MFPSSVPYGAALVIGGAGFIGSRLVADFAARDIPVVVMDNFSRPEPAGIVEVPGKVLVIRGDVLDHGDVERCVRLASNMAIQSSRPPTVAVFMLAAHTANGLMSPDQTRLNVAGPLVVAETLNRLHPDSSANGDIQSALVFASSFAVYGEVPFGLPVREYPAANICPMTDYGRSKADAEAVIRAVYICNRNGRFMSVRLSNVIGAGEHVGNVVTAEPSGGLGFALVRSADPIPVSSHPRPTIDRRTWRNFIDVRDVSAALALAAAYAMMKPSLIAALNVCADEARPIVDLIAAVGCTSRQIMGQPAPGDVAYSHGDNTEAKRKLSGWRPVFTLEDSAAMIERQRSVYRIS